MAEIKYTICDKCGKRLDSRRFVVAMKKPRMNIKIGERSADIFGYTDYDYELCWKCGNAVLDFIRAKPTEKEGAE